MVAGNEAAVEKGKGELNVVRVVAVAFFEGADHGAGAKAEIPHSLVTTADGLAQHVLHFFVCAQVEKVDVGGREEFFAAKAADRHQRDPGRQDRAALELPQGLQQAVDNQGAAADAEHTIACALEGLPHGGHLRLIVLSQLLVRRECRFHVDRKRNAPRAFLLIPWSGEISAALL